MKRSSFIARLVVVVLTFQTCTEGAKILGVFPIAGKSLQMLYNRLMKGLADAGHDVTFISPIGNKLPISNGSFTNIDLSALSEEYERNFNEANVLGTSEQYSVFQANVWSSPFSLICNDTFHDPNVNKFLASNATFDVVITEYLFTESLLIFSHIYKCPVIIFSSVGGINPWVNNIIGNSIPPSYVPHFFMLGDFSRGMTFLQKVHNFFFYLNDLIYKYYVTFPLHNQFLKSKFKNPPDVATLYNNVSLLLLGSHTSVHLATPLVPNMVEIGGFHIDPPKKLPKNLQDFLDSATEGAIYFSMGSHIKSTHFSEEKKTIMLNVFTKLRLKVMWKYENETLPGKPSNLLIQKWVPQMDVLAHPNIKLFITHGGHGSTLETIYHGVPALMIPVFFDQYNNAYQAVNHGYALKLSFNDKNFNEDTILSMIKGMLNNPKYMENAKLRSRLFHDRPMKPLDTAIYWVEYVIRHKGADHLKVGGISLSWYQYYMVDVLVFLLFSLVLAWYGVSYSLKAIFKTCRKTGEIKIKQS